MKMAINCHGKIFWGDMQDYFWLMNNIKSQSHLESYVRSPSAGIPLATKEQIEYWAFKNGWNGKDSSNDQA